jgi:hypothetical protein
LMSPAATVAPSAGSRVTPVDGSGDVKCSANTRAQSAALPGLAPDVQ